MIYHKGLQFHVDMASTYLFMRVVLTHGQANSYAIENNGFPNSMPCHISILCCNSVKLPIFLITFADCYNIFSLKKMQCVNCKGVSAAFILSFITTLCLILLYLCSQQRSLVLTLLMLLHFGIGLVVAIVVVILVSWFI